jgi:hypothetical protein
MTQLNEGLEYHDMMGLVKPTVHIDEFESRMGDDADVIVVSFYLRNRQAADDLVVWLEKGYDFILDADRSPGEIKPNRYLVYAEFRRSPEFVKNFNQVMTELPNLTAIDADKFKIRVGKKLYPYSEKAVSNNVILTPAAYNRDKEGDINEIREAAGLAIKPIYRRVARDLKNWQDLAHITR